MEILNRSTLIPEELLSLVWGPVIKQELFGRWSQGFIFSPHEKTALIQANGGPCAVIAPVQAFLLKNLIKIYQLQQFKELDSSVIDRFLCSSLVELLSLCRLTNNGGNSTGSSSSDISNLSENEGPFQVACLDDPLPPPGERSPTNPAEIDDPSLNSCIQDQDLFHSCIRLRQFDSKYELENFLQSNLEKFKIEFGILLFLYSIILTRGIRKIKTEMGESGETLIDPAEGHGGQALINLLINGSATSYVWDGEKDIGGLKLAGIGQRPSVGFLTKMEHLHYVQVGWYLKNPTNAVWILASESHLTVLFSWCKSLVTPDSECEKAKQVLSWFDADGNKFFQRGQLKDVLNKLSLCVDDDFVEFMYKELDSENVGVILFNKFLETFYSVEQSFTPPDTFDIFHYNGMESSCPENKIRYAEGIATLQESHVAFSNPSEFVMCLNTKWTNVDVQWMNYQASLN